MSERERELELIARGLRAENDELRRQLEAKQSKALFARIASQFEEAGLDVTDARSYLTTTPWRQVSRDGVAEHIEILKAAERRQNQPEGFAPTTGGLHG